MRNAVAAVLCLLLSAAALGDGPAAKEDPIGAQLFPPELVMGHQQEIGLAEGQREAIKREIEKAQSRFLDLQWQMQREVERLVLLLQSRPVEEARVLAQAETVMGLETETKKTHLSLLVRIKNTLSGEQQAKLREIRQRAGK